MGTPKTKTSSSVSLRRRIMAFVAALILLSLCGSTISLYRITEVSRSLDAINRVSVPLGRLFAQMQSDGEIFKREMDRRLGSSHWRDPYWRPRPVPRWVEDVLLGEIAKSEELARQDQVPWAEPAVRAQWRGWIQTISGQFGRLRVESAQLYEALDRGDQDKAAQLYTAWAGSLDEWTRQLQWGVNEYEKVMRQTFRASESRVSQLRTGLEIILIVVVSLSLLLLWLGEQALRPLNELTRLARDIARRGLRKEDKSKISEIPLARTDEVSQLAREFHHMATSLLERERTVEAQKTRLEEQNRLLAQMGELNENILNSINTALLVTDLEGRITQCNPVACEWLSTDAAAIRGTELRAWPQITQVAPEFRQTDAWLSHLKTGEEWRIEPAKVGDRVRGGRVMPLRSEGEVHGAIVVVEDLTEELELADRLRRAENLAAVGRMSAQVAHEVRNPLHSIGLEAEMAADLAAQVGNPALKQSLQSILVAVDRLEKITENYLKLSRLSAGEKRIVDLGEVLENVLATYASNCEALGVRVDWSREPGSSLRVSGDRDLLEQVLGNLLRNSLQALQEQKNRAGFVRFSLGTAESGRVWLMIQDNGPGIAAEVRQKLFTPFVTTRAQGTGLGLSFVKKVIEDHGGAVECPEGGTGATFRVLLPAADLSATQITRAFEEESQHV